MESPTKESEVKTVTCYSVTSVELSGIECLSNEITKEEFYTRDLVIKMADGTEEMIRLFSKDGYQILANDKELQSLKEAA